MRLLSYNIHKGIGGRDRRYDLERVVAVIAAEQPDFIHLQEVTHGARISRYHDQPHLLAETFQMSAAAYQLNVHWSEGGYGNLLLSRWPFATRHQISLRMRYKKPRGAQMVAVDTPDGTLHLVNFHLGLAEDERHWQVRHLLAHPAFKESADLPTLLVGDSNDWRNTLGRGLLDAEGFEQATSPPSRFRSFPAYLPLGSLDKAFYRGPVRVEDARVVHGRATRDASDHLPLVVDFHLR